MITVPSEILTPQTEADFKQFLVSEYGLYIHLHQEERFKEAICKTCQAFSVISAEILLFKLKVDSLCPERTLFIQYITVEESYFFRDENQQNFLRYDFLPNLIAQKRAQNDKRIRIWSAGCSAGQEIYSIAILLHQLLSDFSDWQLQLIASDINHQSLQRALKGEYSLWEIRSNDDLISDSGYFVDLGQGKYQLNEIITKQVRFFFLNLAEDSFPSLMNQTCNLDLILCRNVFIYFERSVIEKTCARFSQALRLGGVLMLSVTDPMNLNIPQLTAKQKDDTFYFERIDEFAEIAPVISEPFVQILPALQSETHIPDKPVEDFAQIKTKILVFLANGQWHEVLTLSSQALLNHPRKSDLAQFKAKALVNLGLLEKAKQACEDSIRFDELDPHSYLLYGLILLQLNLHDEAEKAFRQTIFLNYDFMEAHYQLGQVLLHKGQQKQGIKAIKNALQLAEEGDGQRPVHNVIALTYASFAESIKNELSVLDKGRGV